MEAEGALASASVVAVPAQLPERVSVHHGYRPALRALHRVRGVQPVVADEFDVAVA